MSTLEFQPWPKIARLNRDITITEKIDGTNAAVVIVEDTLDSYTVEQERLRVARVFHNGVVYAVFAQSRTRFITPEQDNYGFAKWVDRNAASLVEILGPGTHFGEWWGSGIQRKYGLTGGDKRFSLFNTGRWGESVIPPAFDRIQELYVVPILYRGAFSQLAINAALGILEENGSVAAPGFARPEGIVVRHEAARQSFKVTLEGDEAPKGQEAHRNDEERIAA